MKIHRFILKYEAGDGFVHITDPETVKQIQAVLKLKKGEQIIIGDGNFNEVLGEITGIQKDRVEVAVHKEQKNVNEPVQGVTLYCAILKRENFELAAQKATEAGVKKIVPIITK